MTRGLLKEEWLDQGRDSNMAGAVKKAAGQHPLLCPAAETGRTGLLKLLLLLLVILGSGGPTVAQRWRLPPRRLRMYSMLAPLPSQLPLAPDISGVAPFQFDTPSRKRAVLPLDVQRNLLIASFMVNGNGPYNFMLDTGVSSAIITDPSLATVMGLRRGQPYRVVGAGGESTGLLAHEIAGVRLSAGHIVAPNLRMLVLSEDVLNLSAYVGIPIHGILGSELFRSFVVGVEPDSRRLVLSAPAHYQPPRGSRWTSLPLTIIAGKAYLDLPVQVTDSLELPLRVVLDTGAGHALSLEAGSAPQLKVPAKHLRSELGRGLTGYIQGSIGRVAGLQLGRYRVQRVLTSFPDSGEVHVRTAVPRNGNVGFELLKRFTLVIDYPHRRILLRPNSQYGEPFEHDMSGVELLAVGPEFRHYLITRVVPGSPAALAGLCENDELVSVNFVSVYTLSLTQLSRIFHSSDGRALLLIIHREGKGLVTATLRLKRQI